MLLNDDEIKERIESPINLLNRLKTGLNKSKSPHQPVSQIPSLPPKSTEIIPDLDDKINNLAAKSKALSILNLAMTQLEVRIPEVQKPETLAKIAMEMSKVISNQTPKNEGTGNNFGQIIVYAPQMQKLEDYEVIDIGE